MPEDNLTFLVTVTYRCPNMIDTETLNKQYEGNLLECWRFISDNFGDEPHCFGELIPESTKVEIEK